jgi:hypothetical protein
MSIHDVVEFAKEIYQHSKLNLSIDLNEDEDEKTTIDFNKN